MMVTTVDTLGPRRRVIWVANRVHRPLSRGNGSPVTPSKTELLPLDHAAFQSRRKHHCESSPLTWIDHQQPRAIYLLAKTNPQSSGKPDYSTLPEAEG